jgi:hypothetical protein
MVRFDKLIILRKSIPESRAPRLKFLRRTVLHISHRQWLLQWNLVPGVHRDLRVERDGGSTSMQIAVERGSLHIIGLVWEVVGIVCVMLLTGARNGYGRGR